MLSYGIENEDNIEREMENRSVEKKMKKIWRVRDKKNVIKAVFWCEATSKNVNVRLLLDTKS